MQKRIAVPTAISSLRLLALPPFLYLFHLNDTTACLILVAFCAATDFLDGYAARRLNAASRFGAYYDAATDFAFVMGVFSVFYVVGYYPLWLLLLIAASFAQFLITSLYTKKLYDPVGRYLGSALYIGIALTLIAPTQAIFIFVEVAFAGFFVVSVASRILSLTRKQAELTLN